MENKKHYNIAFIVFILLIILCFIGILFLNKYNLLLISLMFFFVLFFNVLFLNSKRKMEEEKLANLICFYDYFSKLEKFTIDEIEKINIRNDKQSFNKILENFLCAIKENNTFNCYIYLLNNLTQSEEEIIKNIYLINKNETKNKKELVIFNKVMLLNKPKIQKKESGISVVILLLLMILILTIFIARTIVN
ncbi:MAG: hypothetical protein PUJ92_01390 [Bacilli bacterium]|nr:hypothetical protein [Mollicutes bacterium]MDD7591643.1 hypothetical protein [Bacilli bacterium]MDY5892410.1 hypothetical protein [Candidatus Onthovivens sp.]